MFYISRTAALSGEVRETIEEKIKGTPEGIERNFLYRLLPAIEDALLHYSGMSGVTIAGEIGSKEGRVVINIYANELGE